MSKFKQTVVSLCLMLVASVVALSMLEGFLRWYCFKSLRTPQFNHGQLFRSPHPTRGWQLQPNSRHFGQTLDYAQWMQVNSKGLRDVEHDYERAPDVFRIIVLGDSFMEGYQLPLEQILPQLLQKKLADYKVEVINMGVCSYGPGQEYLYLKEEGLKYKPDLVLLAFYGGNDIANDCKSLNADHLTRARPFVQWDSTQKELVFAKPDMEFESKRFEERMKRVEQDPGLLFNTVLYQMVGMILDPFYNSYDPNIYHGQFLTHYDSEYSVEGRVYENDYKSMWASAFDVTAKVLAEMNRLCRANGVDFVAFTVPARIQVEPVFLAKVKNSLPKLQFDPDKTDSFLMEIGQKEGFPVFNLTPIFRKRHADTGISFYFRFKDNHWNAAGHELAAEILAEELINSSINLTARPLPAPG